MQSKSCILKHWLQWNPRLSTINSCLAHGPPRPILDCLVQCSGTSSPILRPPKSCVMSHRAHSRGVARLWALEPGDFISAPQPGLIPLACGPLLRLIAGTHLPYMRANAKAVAQGAMSVRFEDRGAHLNVPQAPTAPGAWVNFKPSFRRSISPRKKL